MDTVPGVGRDAPRNPAVLVVGAGMSGIGLCVRLKQAGITDITVVEKADRIGGTWRDNTYPGLTCDVPAAIYQYSFALNPDWSSCMAPGAEIRDYLERVVDRYGLRPHILLGRRLTSARFADGKWQAVTADGTTFTVDFLVSATGFLHRPRTPALEGGDAFRGAAFHSARWDHSVDLAGKRVAIVGTGSTGVQLVTALAGTAHRLTVFQRTPQWVLPLPNWRTGRVARGLRRRFPRLHKAERRLLFALYYWFFSPAFVEPGWRRRLIGRLCRAHLRTVTDPELRRRLAPAYPPLCKRIVMSHRYYRAAQHPSVSFVTDRITRLVPHGVETENGTLHEADVLIYATGFDAHSYLRPAELTGPSGRSLSEAWAQGATSYYGIAHPDFPNFFMLIGPHSPVGNDSITAVGEVQARYVVQWIDIWRRSCISTIAPTREATDRFRARVRQALPATVWTAGCHSWYLNQHGDPEVWPWTAKQYADALATPDPGDFTVR
ncbi:flavin-containing monooxygenase [Streptomyces cacaoi]|uniref:Putative monooxygenase n=1 Tax=Streptomyces cacaoi TaxID=1898 RepID=A0A4Y3QTH7_STRCI|nr:NAD(P)/FAD-dependent oxidoreductase [Streptomyces cacaoi]NNG85511.1 NAD(P)/FAD-dependent oxidoreductase [Streptomyces cacaoi]GEB47943.1 putative monooxygenase [Streptomyces cacaoi]